MGHQSAGRWSDFNGGRPAPSVESIQSTTYTSSPPNDHFAFDCQFISFPAQPLSNHVWVGFAVKVPHVVFSAFVYMVTAFAMGFRSVMHCGRSEGCKI